MNLQEKQNNLRDQIPQKYNPYLHWFGTVGITQLICCLLLFSSSLSYILLIFPIVTMGMLFVEYFIHKLLLHRPFFQPLYRYHMNHHLLFNDGEMKIKSLRDLYWILIPQPVYFIVMFGVAVFGAIGGLVFPVGIINSICFSILLFHILYDVCHTCWHTTEFYLGKFHREHHRFESMQHFNMNVTFPVVDWLLGTLK